MVNVHNIQNITNVIIVYLNKIFLINQFVVTIGPLIVETTR